MAIITRTRAAAGLVGTGIVLVALWLNRTGRADPHTLIATLDEVRATGWAVPAYLLFFGLTTFFTPALVLFMVAGVVFGVEHGVAYGWVAANLWANLHFAAGRLVAGPRTRAWLERRGFARLAKEFSHGGVLATVIVRQLPLPFVGVNLAAGASPMAWWRFTAGNALGVIPSSVVYPASAAALLGGVEGARREALVRTVLAAAAIITLGVISRWAQARLSRSDTTPT